MLPTPRRWIGRPNVFDLFEYPVEANDQTHAVHDQPKANKADQRELITADPRTEATDVGDRRRWGKFIVPLVPRCRARND
jgi:hypothetical protein